MCDCLLAVLPCLALRCMRDALTSYGFVSRLSLSLTKINVECSCEAFQSCLPSPPLIYISTQRKAEENSPVKDTDAKQAKQEATINGSGDSSANNGIEEQKSKEASLSLVFCNTLKLALLILLWMVPTWFG